MGNGAWLLLLIGSCVLLHEVDGKKVNLLGAGASFPASVYLTWISHFRVSIGMQNSSS